MPITMGDTAAAIGNHFSASHNHSKANTLQNEHFVLNIDNITFVDGEPAFGTICSYAAVRLESTP